MSDARSATALVLVDLQREFMEDGVLAVPGANRIVRPTLTLIEAARRWSAPVIYTAFALERGDLLGHTSKRLNVPGLHMGEDAALAPWAPRLDSDILIRKPRQSAFLGTPLDLHLRSLGIGRVVVAGLTTNSCVLATAIDAAGRDYEVIVPRETTWAKAVPQSAHTASLEAQAVVDASLAIIQYGIGSVVPLASVDQILEA